MDGIRSESAAEAEIRFSTYRNAYEAERGVSTWSYVCQDTMRQIDEAHDANRPDKAARLAGQLAGYRMLLEDARKRLAEFAAVTIEMEAV